MWVSKYLLFFINNIFLCPDIPEVKYVSNIHGNEVLGRELLLGLADYLCDQYSKHDQSIRNLIQGSRIHLLPSMNPDGWQLSNETVSNSIKKLLCLGFDISSHFLFMYLFFRVVYITWLVATTITPSIWTVISRTWMRLRSSMNVRESITITICWRIWQDLVNL